jgi:hypothetical protein
MTLERLMKDNNVEDILCWTVFRKQNIRATLHVLCKLDESVRLSMLALFLEWINIPASVTRH